MTIERGEDTIRKEPAIPHFHSDLNRKTFCHQTLQSPFILRRDTSSLPSGALRNHVKRLREKKRERRKEISFHPLKEGFSFSCQH